MTPRWSQIPQPEAAPAETRSYDLVKEFVIALVVVILATIALAAVFGAPDDKPVTLASWSKADPADFTATAVAELAGTSGSAQYGPPYNSASDGQKLGPLALAEFAGVRHPIDSANDFVLTPLSNAPQTPAVAAALAQAQAGSLDGALLAQGGFYQSDYTRPLLFVADGQYLAGLANDRHLAGDQWGMMNETGSYPGQAWLWLYTLWYQVSPFDHSANGDALVWGLMALLTLVFVLVPFIPGIRSIPRYVPLYRLVWRDHYRRQRTE